MDQHQTSPKPRGKKVAPPFTPVPRRHRHDGWTAERQAEFLETLAETGSVTAAARAVGMDRRSAYVLRRGPSGEAFAAAWDAALDSSHQHLHEAALARAIHGVPRPIFRGGEQVGEYRHFDERLTTFLLRARSPQRFGRWRDSEEPTLPLDPDSVLAMLMASRQLAESDTRRPPRPRPPRTEDDITADIDRLMAELEGLHRRAAPSGKQP